MLGYFVNVYGAKSQRKGVLAGWARASCSFRGLDCCEYALLEYLGSNATPAMTTGRANPLPSPKLRVTTDRDQSSPINSILSGALFSTL